MERFPAILDVKDWEVLSASEAKLLIEREASLQGPVPGSSVPHPDLAVPPPAGQHTLFTFCFLALTPEGANRDIHSLVTLQGTVQCGLTFIHF